MQFLLLGKIQSFSSPIYLSSTVCLRTMYGRAFVYGLDTVRIWPFGYLRSLTEEYPRRMTSTLGSYMNE